MKLHPYLSGVTEDMPGAFHHLAEIFQYQVFELCMDQASGNYLIPYMMNDALEYYLVLKDSRKTGDILPEEAVISAQLAREEKRYILIIRQESGNICTLLFKEIEECAQCYQYHRIGHFWVKGQEHWRRLVYIIGTIYDKYEYFGDRFCSDKEKALMHLIGFAPFRYWSPLRETLEERYSDSAEGLETMENLAAEAKDCGYQRLLRLYRRFPFPFAAYILGRKLLSPKRRELYELICRKVAEASLEYQERDYGPSKNEEIKNRRKQVESRMRSEGYAGSYPIFQKGGRMIFATEEHPFTIMEQEDFVFRIQLMVFESDHIYIEETESKKK